MGEVVRDAGQAAAEAAAGRRRAPRGPAAAAGRGRVDVEGGQAVLRVGRAEAAEGCAQHGRSRVVGVRRVEQARLGPAALQQETLT